MGKNMFARVLEYECTVIYNECNSACESRYIFTLDLCSSVLIMQKPLDNILLKLHYTRLLIDGLHYNVYGIALYLDHCRTTPRPRAYEIIISYRICILSEEDKS